MIKVWNLTVNLGYEKTSLPHAILSGRKLRVICSAHWPIIFSMLKETFPDNTTRLVITSLQKKSLKVHRYDGYSMSGKDHASQKYTLFSRMELNQINYSLKINFCEQTFYFTLLYNNSTRRTNILWINLWFMLLVPFKISWDQSLSVSSSPFEMIHIRMEHSKDFTLLLVLQGRTVSLLSKGWWCVTLKSP